MIISKTPFRISFFGGGTDYPAWIREHGGAVLSTSIDKYCYVTCRYLPPFFDHKYRIAYSRIENVRNATDIEHPAVRAVIQEMGFEEGLEIHVDADLPARSGLGSSSSFVVGLLNALNALRGSRVSKHWLAIEAIRIEQQILAETVGSQDQVAAAHGGFNAIYFSPEGKISVQPVILNSARGECLNQRLMLFFTGFTRIASNIAKATTASIHDKTVELKIIRRMVDEGLKLLESKDDIRSFGELLHSTWEVKRKLNQHISTPKIDKYYNVAREAGAIGGKLLGAGGGGFMLLFVEPDRQATVTAALSDLIHVPFKFECSGSELLHY